MISYFPRPYPDEIFYSWLARFANHTLQQSSHSVNRQLFDRDVVPMSIDFAHSLLTFSRKINQIMDLDPEQVIYYHTLWPFYSNFISPSKHDRFVLMMKEKTEMRRMIGGFNLPGFKTTRLPKYCPICVKDDLKRYGEIYWHRRHQIPDILICVEHNCFLEKIVTHEKSIRSRSYIYPDSKNCPIVNVKENKIEILHSIASTMVSYLKSSIPTRNIDIDYKWIAIEKGYYKSIDRNRLDLTRLIRELKSHFDSIISLLINDNYSEKMLQFRAILRTPNSVFHPIKHEMVSSFLRSLEIKKCEAEKTSIFGDGPWPCLNRVSPHFNELVIEKMTISRTQNKLLKATFECGCGMTYELFEKKNSREFGRIITEYGTYWKDYVQKKILDGITGAELSRTLGIGHVTLSNWCDRYGISHPWKKHNAFKRQLSLNGEIQNMRIFWAEKLTAFGGSLSDFTKIFNKEYQWIRKYDRVWVVAFNQAFRKRKKNTKNRTKDWSRIDKEKLHQIKLLRHELLSKNLNQRITKHLLLRCLEVNGGLRLQKKLPETFNAAKELSESIEDYQIRRINMRARQMSLNGGLVDRSLYVKASIFRHKASKQVIDYIESVINDNQGLSLASETLSLDLK